jgi:uncharacterized protein (DUF1330 family)
MDPSDKFVEFVRAALAGIPDGHPVVMLNLLRYRAAARYPEAGGFEPCSGRRAYQRYSREAVRFVAGAGGGVVWRGAAQVGLIAPPGERWDDVLLVSYPSKQAFLDMIADPGYQAIVVHRTAALEDSRLLAMLPADG